MLNTFANFNNMLYIDPAATTALVSSITVIAASLGATFIILWGKFRKKFFAFFNLNEFKGKELEDKLEVLDPEIKDEADKIMQENLENGVAATQVQESVWKKIKKLMCEENPNDNGDY